MLVCGLPLYLASPVPWSSRQATGHCPSLNSLGTQLGHFSRISLSAHSLQNHNKQTKTPLPSG
jgi:hypothetical protein